MKNVFTLICLSFLFSFSAWAQNSSGLEKGEKSGIRFISVNGNAEKEVTPDIIYLNLSLKEYYLDKDGKNKIFIEDLEKNFQRIVLDNGIPNENLSIESIAGFTKLSQRHKNENYLVSKSYKLKLNDLDKVNAILDKIDPKALANVYISGYDYSQIEQVKRELRIKAMINAKNKASYCLAAVDESIGSLLESEIDESTLEIPQNFMPMARMATVSMGEGNLGSDSIDFKKIKLTATVRLKFQIK